MIGLTENVIIQVFVQVQPLIQHVSHHLFVLQAQHVIVTQELIIRVLLQEVNKELLLQEPEAAVIAQRLNLLQAEVAEVILHQVQEVVVRTHTIIIILLLLPEAQDHTIVLLHPVVHAQAEVLAVVEAVVVLLPVHPVVEVAVAPVAAVDAPDKLKY